MSCLSSGENPWVDEILFKAWDVGSTTTGKLIYQCSCAAQRDILMQGQLYVSENFVFFYANIFGIIYSLKIPVHTIIGIDEVQMNFLIYSIAIKTHETVHAFTTFWDRASALNALRLSASNSIARRRNVEHFFHPLKHIVVAATFPVNLNSFVRSFLVNDSTTSFWIDTDGCLVEKLISDELPRIISDPEILSLPKFHMMSGDTDLQVEPWKDIEEAIGNVDRVQERSYRFCTRFEGSSGVIPTMALKVQCLRRFEDLGVAMDSSLVLQDIPSGDCFKIKDRWMLEPSSSKTCDGDLPTVRLTISFEFEWLKNSSLQSMIEETLSVSMTRFFEAFVQTMQRRICGHVSPPRAQFLSVDDSDSQLNENKPSTPPSVDQPVTLLTYDAPDDTRVLNKIWHSEIVHDIFNETGIIHENFPCTVDKACQLHGMMYLTDSALCFYANDFGENLKLKIPWSAIKLIAPESSHALIVTTYQEVYVFRHFEFHNIVIDALTKLFDEKRVFFEKIVEREEQYLVTAPLPYHDSVQELAIHLHEKEKQEFKHTSVIDNFDVDVHGFLNAFIAGGTSSLFSAPSEVHHFTAADVLDVTDYHKQKGDTEIVLEPWVADVRLPSTSDSTVNQKLISRSFTFRIPLDPNPFGPTSTRAAKNQSCFLFGVHGAIVDSVTTLKDVPFADYFVVQDRWVISPIAAETHRVRIVVTYQIKWLKFTVLKSIIEQFTIEGVNKFFRNCIEVMKEKFMFQGKSRLSQYSAVKASNRQKGIQYHPKLAALIAESELKELRSWRQTYVELIFGKVGVLNEILTCALDMEGMPEMHGRIFITDLHLCFYSKMFGWEEVCRIPHRNIRALERLNCESYSDAIIVSTSSHRYILSRFWDREFAFETLRAYFREDHVEDTSEIDKFSITTSTSEIISEGDFFDRYVLQNKIVTASFLFDVESFLGIVVGCLDSFCKHAFPVDTLDINLLRGDVDIDLNNWKLIDDPMRNDVGHRSFFRSFRFTNKLRAVTSQLVRTDCQRGAIVFIETIIEDSPCSETFSIEELWTIVLVDPAHDNIPRVQWTVSYELKWLTKTSLKPLIEAMVDEDVRMTYRIFSRILESKLGSHMLSGHAKSNTTDPFFDPENNSDQDCASDFKSALDVQSEAGESRDFDEVDFAADVPLKPI